MNSKNFTDLVNTAQHPVDDVAFRSECKLKLDQNGVLVLPGFLNSATFESIQVDGEQNKKKCLLHIFIQIRHTDLAVSLFLIEIER